MVRALVAVCNGSEEVETVTPVDVLRRAGAEVVLAASGDSLLVTLSRGIKIQADKLINEIEPQDWDVIVVPGGPGASNLRDDEKLISLLKKQKESDKWIASICASPVVVLKTHGIIDGISSTCYPALAAELPGRSDQKVVVDSKIITSQGPATAMEFSLQIVKTLFGEDTYNDVGSKLLAI